MEKLKLEATQQAKKELALEALGLNAGSGIPQVRSQLQPEREKITPEMKQFRMPKQALSEAEFDFVQLKKK